MLADTRTHQHTTDKVEADEELVSLYLPKTTVETLESVGRGLDLSLNEICRRILATSLKTMLVERSI
jgi:hypothetical protein